MTRPKEQVRVPYQAMIWDKVWEKIVATDRKGKRVLIDKPTGVF